MLGIAFVFGWGALFARTYRIAKIFQANRHLRKAPRVRDLDLAIIIAILLIIEILIFGVWAALDNWKAVRNSDGHLVCDAGYKLEFLAVLFIYKLILMLWGCWLAWQTRNVYKEFNESKYIFGAIVAWLVLAVVALPLLFTGIVTQGDLVLDFCIQFILVAIGISVVVGFIFVPKFLAMYRMSRDPEYAKKFAKSQDIGTRSARTGTLHASEFKSPTRSLKPESNKQGHPDAGETAAGAIRLTDSRVERASVQHSEQGDDVENLSRSKPQ
eukprot:ANDGO_00448.mRNA.1 Metabotropic glutamate receptor-like protein E